MLRNDWEDADADVGSTFVFPPANCLTLSVSTAGYIRVFWLCTGEGSSVRPEKSDGSDRAEPEERRIMPQVSTSQPPPPASTVPQKTGLEANGEGD